MSSSFEPDVRVLHDPDRLYAVRSTGLLDTAPEEEFDRITRLVGILLKVPAAFVSLVDEHRDFYKSCVGFGEPLATVRSLEGTTFCHYAIAGTDPLVIPDTRAHPIYARVPTVETLGVAAYLGVPIRGVGGAAIGSLCAIDFQPRSWSDTDVAAVAELAASAERIIEIRRQHAVLRGLNQALGAELEHSRAVNGELERTNDALHQSIAAAQAARDLAARAQAEAQRARADAERANVAKTQFLASMSHEIRTPINAVLGYADLLAAEVGGALTAQQQAYVSRVLASGRHLLGLVDEVLDLSKIEAGEMSVAAVDTTADAAVRASVAMVTPQAQAKGVELHVDPDWSRSGYVGDDHRVRQIVLNLLSNAVKFTDAGGAVFVRCWIEDQPPRGASLPLTGPWLVVEVRDTGRGIAPEQQLRIFEPFVQAAGELHERPSGTGLGLTISRRFARLMGGDLRVESSTGVGSAFSLWLPATHQDRLPHVDWGDAELPVGPQVSGAGELGTLLLESVRQLETDLAARLKADPQVPSARELDDLSLEYQTGPIVAGLGKVLHAVAGGGGAPYEDARQTLDLLYTAHGRQRRRLGWTVEELARELRLLHDVLDGFVRTQAMRRTHSELVPALGVLHREVSRGARIGIDAFTGVEVARGLSDELKTRAQAVILRMQEVNDASEQALRRVGQDVDRAGRAPFTMEGLRDAR